MRRSIASAHAAQQPKTISGTSAKKPGEADVGGVAGQRVQLDRHGEDREFPPITVMMPASQPPEVRGTQGVTSATAGQAIGRLGLDALDAVRVAITCSSPGKTRICL